MFLFGRLHTCDEPNSSSRLDQVLFIRKKETYTHFDNRFRQTRDKQLLSKDMVMVVEKFRFQYQRDESFFHSIEDYQYIPTKSFPCHCNIATKKIVIISRNTLISDLNTKSVYENPIFL